MPYTVPNTHPSIPITNKITLSRTFFVGNEDAMSDMAAQITHQILVAPSPRLAVEDAADFIYDAGSAHDTFSRTTALVANQVWCLLAERDLHLAKSFEKAIEFVAVEVFLGSWKAASSPRSTDVNDSEQMLPEESDLIRSSAILADLYAMSLVTPSGLKACVESVVDAFLCPDHLIILVTIFSRANSYNGLRINFSWYLGLKAKIRNRCLYHFKIAERCNEEGYINSFICELSRDAQEAMVDDSPYCEIPFFHQVDPFISVEGIFSEAGTFLDGCDWNPKDDKGDFVKRFERLGVPSSSPDGTDKVSQWVSGVVHPDDSYSADMVSIDEYREESWDSREERGGIYQGGIAQGVGLGINFPTMPGTPPPSISIMIGNNRLKTILGMDRQDDGDTTWSDQSLTTTDDL